jgi:hypothetical protein
MKIGTSLNEGALGSSSVDVCDADVSGGFTFLVGS